MASRTAIALSAFLLFSLPIAQPARAVSLTIAGPTSGPITSGTGLELIPTPASQVTITFGLSLATSINGYDVTIAWDPTEVSLAGDTQLFPSGMPPDTLLFTVAADPTSSAGTRVATISLTAFTTTSLFSLTFNLGALVQDGAPDVRIFVDAMTNGAGLAPGSVLLENDSGAGLDLAPLAVPEPASAGLLSTGLAFLAGRRRRRGPRRTPRESSASPSARRAACLAALLAVVLLAAPALARDATHYDVDGDLVNDYCDNCLQLPNRDQRNTDLKAEMDAGITPTGDLCDCDLDDDGDCDGDDFLDFQSDFSNGTDSGIGSDQDDSGIVNISDFNLFLAAAADGAPGPGANVGEIVIGADEDGICSGECDVGVCWDGRAGPMHGGGSDGCSLTPADLAPLGFPSDGNVDNPTDQSVSDNSGGLYHCPNAAFGTFRKPGAVCGVDVDLDVCGASKAGLPCGPGSFCRVDPTKTCASNADCTEEETLCIAGYCAPDPPKPCTVDDDCGSGFKCVGPLCGDVRHPRACEKHDDCGDVCGYRKKQCDNQFRRDLFAICNALEGLERDHCYDTCIIFATFYATDKDRDGLDDGVWSDDDLENQIAKCDCCPEPGPDGEPPVCGDGRCDAFAETCRSDSCPEDCGPCTQGGACLIDADCSGLACLPDGHCGKLPALSACQSDGMCKSGDCTLGTCIQSCGDGACDGTEKCGAADLLLACNTDCGKCGTGESCLIDADCASDACNFGLCIGSPLPGGSICSTNNACLSGACNFGVCLGAPLPNGGICSTNSACTSGICNLGVCIAGGLPALSLCSTDAACRNGSCPAGLCEQICNDGFCDGLEKCGDVNGGLECTADCGKCGTGALCTSNSDCTSAICNFGFCIAAPLPALSPCTTGAACRSGSCPAGLCAQICGDGFCDGTESCGNANSGIECNNDCSTCGNGHTCTQNADCTSGACNFGFCIADGSVGVGGSCTTAAACSNDICQLGCCGRPVTAACTRDSQCCSNNCVTDIIGNRSCSLFSAASQPAASETGGTETEPEPKKQSKPKKTKPPKGAKKP